MYQHRIFITDTKIQKQCHTPGHFSNLLDKFCSKSFVNLFPARLNTRVKNFVKNSTKFSKRMPNVQKESQADLLNYSNSKSGLQDHF